MRPHVLYSFLTITLFCAFFTRCGNSSQTGNGIYGTVLLSDGSPASYASINVRKSGNRDVLDSTNAKPDGTFEYKPTETGLYSFEVTLDSNMAYINDILVGSLDEEKRLPPKILRPAGSIVGSIHLPKNGNYKDIIILIYGIMKFGVIDTNGNFRIDNIAEGIYNIHFLSFDKDYGSVDSSHVVVKPSETTYLETTIMPYMGIPVTSDLIISYDQVKQIATLKWNITDTDNVIGYHIYRKDTLPSSSQHLQNFPINSKISRVKSFIDSTVFREVNYEYSVYAIDTNNVQAKRGAVQQLFTRSAFPFDKFIGKYEWKVLYSRPTKIAIDSTGRILVSRINYQTPNNEQSICMFDTVGQFSKDTFAFSKDSIYKIYAHSNGTFTTIHVPKTRADSEIQIITSDSTGNELQVRSFNLEEYHVTDLAWVNNRYLYILYNLNKLKILDSNGTVINDIYQKDGEFKGIAVLSNSTVVIARTRTDSSIYESHVDIYTNGVLSDTFTVRKNVSINSIYITPAGNIACLTDASPKQKILFFSPQGVFLAQFGPASTTRPYHLDFKMQDIAFDRWRRMYIVDYDAGILVYHMPHDL
jgi:hypothetical protein